MADKAVASKRRGMGGSASPSVAETLNALAALMRREHVLTPDEARANGYASIEEIADKLHIGESAARTAMKRLEQQGKVERTSVKQGRAIVSYWRVKD